MWRFFKDFFVYGIASIIGKVAAVFLMPIYTSILTQEEYGAQALIASFILFFDVLANLNIHSGIGRDYYETSIEQRKKLVSTGFFSVLGCSIPLTICVILCSGWITADILEIPRYKTEFCIYACTLVATSCQTYFAVITRFRKKPILFTIGTALKIAVQMSISIYGVVVLRAGIISIMIGALCSECFGALFYGFINRESIGVLYDKKIIKRALLFSIPTIPAIVAGWLDSSFGQILIGKYISVADAGVYSIALHIASVFGLVNVAFHNVWSPYLFENYKKTTFEKEVKRLYATIMLILILISVNISLFSNEIILLLSNESYLSAAKYLTLLCLPMSIYVTFPFASSGVSISRDTKYISISYVAGSLLNVLVLFALLPNIGVIGVPIALFASRISTFYILYYVTKAKGLLTLPQSYIILLVVSVICCYAINSMMNIHIRVVAIVFINIALLLYSYKKLNVAELVAQIVTKRR